MKVCIREILETVVDAESITDAELMYNKCEVILESDDLKSVEFIELCEDVI